ncbi:hypothetical protein [Scytonema sp. NUACC21]
MQDNLLKCCDTRSVTAKAESPTLLSGEDVLSGFELNLNPLLRNRKVSLHPQGAIAT